MLATSWNIYKVYVADMHSDKIPMADVQGWRRLQIAAAQPVTSINSSLRSDELVGTKVRSPQNEALGSIDDLVMNLQYREDHLSGDRPRWDFAIDEKLVPVPEIDFKITPNVKLLVLDATKGTLEAAPQANKDQFTIPGHFRLAD